MPFWPNGQPIKVVTNGDEPVSFRYDMREHEIELLSIHWRVHTHWWKGTDIWRDYWEVTTDTHWWAVIYRDMFTDEWRLERVFE